MKGADSASAATLPARCKGRSRCGPQVASIIRRMEASYPTIRERDLISAVARVRSRPRLTSIKGETEDWYLVAYPDQHDLEAFLAKLRRLGVSDIRPVPDDDLARAIPK